MNALRLFVISINIVSSVIAMDKYNQMPTHDELRALSHLLQASEPVKKSRPQTFYRDPYYNKEENPAIALRQLEAPLRSIPPSKDTYKQTPTPDELLALWHLLHSPEAVKKTRQQPFFRDPYYKNPAVANRHPKTTFSSIAPSIEPSFEDRFTKSVSLVEKFKAPITSACFSLDSRSLLTGSHIGLPTLWNIENQAAIYPIFLIGLSNHINHVVFSPDSTKVLAGDTLKTAGLWDLKDLKEYKETEGKINFLNHEKSIVALAFSPNSKYALTASSDHLLRLWDLTDLSNEHLTPHILGGLTQGILSIAISPDGQYALTGSEDKTARLWNLSDLSNITSIPLGGHTDAVTSVAFSPDSKYALTGSKDTTARLWDLRNINNPYVFRDNEGGITSISFSPQGTFAIIGCGLNAVRLWNILNIHDATCIILDGTIASLHPQERLAITGSRYSGTVKLWNLSDNDNISCKILHKHNSFVNVVAFSSNGTYALSGSDDGTTMLYVDNAGPLNHSPIIVSSTI